MTNSFWTNHKNCLCFCHCTELYPITYLLWTGLLCSEYITRTVYISVTVQLWYLDHSTKTLWPHYRTVYILVSVPNFLPKPYLNIICTENIAMTINILISVPHWRNFLSFCCKNSVKSTHSVSNYTSWWFHEIFCECNISWFPHWVHTYAQLFT